MMTGFELMTKLTFERQASTDDEKKAIAIIKEAVNELGLTAYTEEFSINHGIEEDSYLEANGIVYKIAATIGSKNIIEDTTKEFVVIDSLDAIEYFDLEDKAVLFPSRLTYDCYEKIIKKKACALFSTFGSVYDKINETDLTHGILRPRHLENGKMACFNIRAIDAEKLVESSPKFVTFRLKTREELVKSNNIIVDIKGKEEKTIVFTAHYDSVEYSKGVYDNGSGVGCLYDLMKLLKDNSRYNLRFIFTGAEERGLLGAKYHTENNNLDNVLVNINVDMIGVNLGYDLACVSGNQAFMHLIKNYSYEVGFPIRVYQGVYSSDSTPFADKGVPSVSFARDAYDTGARIHSRLDNGLFLNEYIFNRTTNFIYSFVNRLNESVIFPIKKEIPEEIVVKINKYFGRK